MSVDIRVVFHSLGGGELVILCTGVFWELGVSWELVISVRLNWVLVGGELGVGA